MNNNPRRRGGCCSIGAFPTPAGSPKGPWASAHLQPHAHAAQHVQRDDFDEHWGESAYVVAMAWHLGGAADPELQMAAESLVAGFAAFSEVPHMRSFNWQCRSAVATPWFLAP